MKKALLVFSLVVALAAPAMASPRDDDPHGPRNVVQRVVHMLQRLIHAFDEEPLIGPPKP